MRGKEESVPRLLRPCPGQKFCSVGTRVLKDHSRETAKQTFFPSTVLRPPRDFQWLWVGELGIVCCIKHKADSSSYSYRAGAGSQAWNVSRSRSRRSACVGPIRSPRENGQWRGSQPSGTTPKLAEKSQPCSPRLSCSSNFLLSEMAEKLQLVITNYNGRKEVGSEGFPPQRSTQPCETA